MDPCDRLHRADLAPLAQLFHENSKINRSSLTYLAESIGEFTASPDELRRSTTAAKTYPGGKRIELSRLRAVPRPHESLDRVLTRRRSVRECSSRPVALPLLAGLFKHSCGITGEMRHPDHPEITQA